MRILKAACLLFLAPLVTCGNQELATKSSALLVDSLPTCKSGEFLVYTGTGIACSPVQGVTTLPDCSTGGRLLTFTTAGGLSCSAPGNASISTTDMMIINNAHQALVATESTLKSLEMNPPSPNARYCGTTAATTMGRISNANNTAFGLSATNSHCSQITACGASARMCTVYDLYYSVAAGLLKQTDTLAKSWVYMGSWQSFGTAEEPTAGLGDNCGSYTESDSSRRGWYGTAAQWENTAAGDRVLKFYTGPDRTGIGSPTGNYAGAPCNVALPIACCR